MKFLSLIITIIVFIVIGGLFQLLDNFSAVILLSLFMLLIGTHMNFSGKGSTTYKAIGWGLFYGSLISLFSSFAFLFWLFRHMPR